MTWGKGIAALLAVLFVAWLASTQPSAEVHAQQSGGVAEPVQSASFSWDDDGRLTVVPSGFTDPLLIGYTFQQGGDSGELDGTVDVTNGSTTFGNATFSEDKLRDAGLDPDERFLLILVDGSESYRLTVSKSSDPDPDQGAQRHYLEIVQVGDPVPNDDGQYDLTITLNHNVGNDSAPVDIYEYLLSTSQDGTGPYILLSKELQSTIALPSGEHELVAIAKRTDTDREVARSGYDPAKHHLVLVEIDIPDPEPEPDPTPEPVPGDDSEDPPVPGTDDGDETEEQKEVRIAAEIATFSMNFRPEVVEEGEERFVRFSVPNVVRDLFTFSGDIDATVPFDSSTLTEEMRGNTTRCYWSLPSDLSSGHHLFTLYSLHKESDRELTPYEMRFVVQGNDEPQEGGGQPTPEASNEDPQPIDDANRDENAGFNSLPAVNFNNIQALPDGYSFTFQLDLGPIERAEHVYFLFAAQQLVEEEGDKPDHFEPYAISRPVYNSQDDVYTVEFGENTSPIRLFVDVVLSDGYVSRKLNNREISYATFFSTEVRDFGATQRESQDMTEVEGQADDEPFVRRQRSNLHEYTYAVETREGVVTIEPRNEEERAQRTAKWLPDGMGGFRDRAGRSLHGPEMNPPSEELRVQFMQLLSEIQLEEALERRRQQREHQAQPDVVN